LKAKLNAIFNASVEGIITIDRSDTIVSANAAVEAIFGYQPEELIDCSINILMPSYRQRQLNDSRLPQAR
jgi:PAS domain S-box-containing protein